MARNWSGILAVKAAAWNIAQPEVTILDSKITAAAEVLSIAESSERTESTTALLNMRFKDLTEYMRYMRTRKFLVPPLTNADIVSLGLKPKDEIRTNVPAPTDIARGSVELTIRYVLTILQEIIVGPHSDGRANHGVRVNYGVVVDDPAAQSAKTGKQYYLAAPPRA